jgi:hypothetical protein
VKVIEDPKPSSTCRRLVNLINVAHSNRASNVLAARKFNSGNIVITAHSHETKNLIEQEEE